LSNSMFCLLFYCFKQMPFGTLKSAVQSMSFLNFNNRPIQNLRQWNRDW
jgi:hypothetical protein